MKTKSILAVFLSAVTALALLAGCTNSQSAGNTTQSATQGQMLFPGAIPDSDTLAATIFDPAIALYRDFDGLDDIKTADETCTAPLDGNDQTFSLVDDPRYPTYQSFVDALGNCFSDELVQNLLAKGYYIEQDGKFYALGAARGSNIYFHDVTYAVTSQTQGRVVFTATARYIDDTSPTDWLDMPAGTVIPDSALTSTDYQYDYELINGKWVFTDFQLFY